jgi:hypothetical protein
MNEENDVTAIPDPIWHRNISFVKSALRIIAGLFLCLSGSMLGAGIFLILAEILGIVEEMV